MSISEEENIDDLIEYELSVAYEEEQQDACVEVDLDADEHSVIQEKFLPHEESQDKTYVEQVAFEGTEVHEYIVQDENVANQETIDAAPVKSKPKQVSVRGPRRFLLFDNLVAEVVDYDEEDDAPIVEFSMCADEDDEEKLPVECGICPDVMHRSKLEHHVKTHLKPGTDPKRYMCIYCDDNFVSRAYAAGHARRHKGIRPYVCSPCKLYYCTKQDLKVHQQRRHWAKEHICELCGKTFAQNTSLKNHRILVHEQQRRFGCEHCGKRFLRNYAMKEHVRNVHMRNRRLLDCPFCDMRFRDTHKLAQHRKDAHLKQAFFECRACGLEFTNIDFFDAHRRSLQCGKKYKRNEKPLGKEHETESSHPEQLHQTIEVDEMKKEEEAEEQEFLYEITVGNL